MKNKIILGMTAATMLATSVSANEQIQFLSDNFLQKNSVYAEVYAGKIRNNNDTALKLGSQRMIYDTLMLDQSIRISVEKQADLNLKVKQFTFADTMVYAELGVEVFNQEDNSKSKQVQIYTGAGLTYLYNKDLEFTSGLKIGSKTIDFSTSANILIDNNSYLEFVVNREMNAKEDRFNLSKNLSATINVGFIF